MTPAEMTRELLRREGYTLLPSEWRVPRTHRKKDLGGFADLVCCRRDDKVLAVQRTAGYHTQDHVDKIKGLSTAWEWLATEHARIEIWDFRDLKEGWWLKRTELVIDWDFGPNPRMIDLQLIDSRYSDTVVRLAPGV